MTVKELKKILEAFDDNAEVITFDPESGVMFDIENASDNNGAVQLNIC